VTAWWAGPRQAAGAIAKGLGSVLEQPDGKIRVTSGSWDGEKVIMRDQVLEIRNANSDGRLHVARKLKNHDDRRYPQHDQFLQKLW
jgi:hypothetical protein